MPHNFSQSHSLTTCADRETAEAFKAKEEARMEKEREKDRLWREREAEKAERARRKEREKESARRREDEQRQRALKRPREEKEKTRKAWVRPRLRVRLVEKSYCGGRFYKEKVRFALIVTWFS